MTDNTEHIKRALTEAFYSEARVQIQKVLTGLVALETSELQEETTPIVEHIFREIHNLKGSAKGIGLKSIVAICHPIEDILVLLKRRQIAISPNLLDCLIAVSTALEKHICAPGIELTIKEIDHHKTNLLKYAGQTQQHLAIETDPEQPSKDTENVEFGPVDRRSTSRDRRRSDYSMDEIRISAVKLEGLLQRAEDMIPARLMAGQQSNILKILTGRLEENNRSLKNRIMNSRIGMARVEELVAQNGNASDLVTLKRIKETLEEQTRFIEQIYRECIELARNSFDLAYLTESTVESVIDESRRMLMMPSSSILGALPLMLRQLSKDLGKEVELTLSGHEVEFDKRVLAGLRDPLAHIIRNCVDHGIEAPDIRITKGKPRKGKLLVSVHQLGSGNAAFTIEDDGNGIDCDEVCRIALEEGQISQEQAATMTSEDKLRLIFLSNLSTKRTVSEISGRGIGMSVVEKNVTALGGKISVSSELGQGTKFVLTVPVAIATFTGLMITVGARSLLLPCTEIDRVMRIPREDVKMIEDGSPSLVLDEKIIPACFLGDLLHVEKVRWSDSLEPHFNAVVLGEKDQRVVFLVDEILDEHEILLKPLGPAFQGLSIYLGVTLLSNGRLAPVLNPREVISTFLRQRVSTATAQSTFGTFASSEHNVSNTEISRRRRILVVDDTLTARMLLTHVLESAGFDIQTASDGLEALEISRCETFDLIITDLEMPRMNGFELTEAIKKESSIPVIIVTSMTSREERERGVSVGANAYFVKGSFDQTNLLEVIGSLI